MIQQPIVTVRDVNNVSVMDLKGDVTSLSEEPIKQAYLEVSKKGGGKILLVFQEEDDINSAGIAILIDIVLESQKKEEHIRIAHPSEHFRKIFALVALTDYVEIFSSEEKALDGF